MHYRLSYAFHVETKEEQKSSLMLQGFSKKKKKFVVTASNNIVSHHNFTNKGLDANIVPHHNFTNKRLDVATHDHTSTLPATSLGACTGNGKKVALGFNFFIITLANSGILRLVYFCKL